MYKAKRSRVGGRVLLSQAIKVVNHDADKQVEREKRADHHEQEEVYLATTNKTRPSRIHLTSTLS